MTIAIVLSILIAGFIFYYLLFNNPPSDCIFTSNSNDEIENMQNYLRANGINTYIKARDLNRLLVVSSDLTDPSLHVIDIENYKKAIELIHSYEKKEEPFHEKLRHESHKK